MATEMMIFETKDNEIKLTVPVENETVWLTQAQNDGTFSSRQNGYNEACE